MGCEQLLSDHPSLYAVQGDTRHTSPTDKVLAISSGSADPLSNLLFPAPHIILDAWRGFLLYSSEHRFSL